MGEFTNVASISSNTPGKALRIHEVPRTPGVTKTGDWKLFFDADGLWILEDNGDVRKIADWADGVTLTDGRIPILSSGQFTQDAGLAYSSGQLQVSDLRADLLNHPQVAAPGTPVDGDRWHDSTQNAFLKYTAGRKIYPGDILYTQTVGDAVVSSSSEGSLAGTGVGSLALPADFFVVGRMLKITARGFLGTKASAPGTLRIRFKLGSTVVGDTTAITVTAGLGTSPYMYWEASVHLVCSVAGAGGVVGQPQGYFDHQTAAQGNPTRWQMINSANVSLDTTAAHTIDWTAQWSVADALNTIQSRTGIVEVAA